MKYLKLYAAFALMALPSLALGGNGLAAPAVESVWPHWQARITVQTAAVSPLSYFQWVDSAHSTRNLQGAALLGDYYFAMPSFGSFRASGGLMVGSTGGAWLLSATAGPRLGLTVQTGGLAPAGPVEGLATVPYLGLGFSSALPGDSLAVTADLGLVAGGRLGQALLGTQGMERALRELRLEPVFQLGVRYRF